MKKFTKDYTTILKGIAVILLCIHHGLQSTDYTFLIAGKDLVSNIQSFSKLCVAIFVILSAYGLFVSYEGKNIKGIKENIRFVSVHIIKIYMTFWLVYIVAVLILGNFVVGNVGTVYAEHPFYYMMLDGMGLSYFTGTPKYVNSWWYISATFVYYICFPVLYKLVRKLKQWNYLLLLSLAVGLFLKDGMNTVLIYFVFFLFGMIFAERDIVNRSIIRLEETNKWKKVLKVFLCGVIFIFVTGIRLYFLDEKSAYYILDWILALLLMMGVAEFSVTKGIFWKILKFFGECSFEIFLIHGIFIRYFTEIIFYTQNPIGIVVRVLFVASLAAVLLKILKRLLHFDKLYKIFCDSHRYLKVMGSIICVWILLFLPRIIGDLGIGELQVKNNKVEMLENKYHVVEFTSQPLLWDFADVRYESTDSTVAFCSDQGIIFSYKKGETQIKISLPGREETVIQVIVK